MTRRYLLVLLLAAAALPARAQAPNPPERPAYAAWERGRDAERAGKPAEAFAAYSEALRDEPNNPEYRALVERTRFALALSLSNQAERAMLADDPVGAATELRRALSVDPQNEIARERLRQIERHAVQETSATPDFSAAPPELSPQSGTRDFSYRGSVRGAYLELAQKFGLLAVFDEDVSRAQLEFKVTGVDFGTARNLLGEQTGTFIRPLDSHSFLVVNDTQQKRKEFLPQIERTLLLSESEKPEQMNEIVRAVRDITGLTHTQFDTRSRTLTVRGAQRDVALASALVRQLEQPRGEVMLEIDVLEVDRNAAENLGIVPPSSAQLVTLSASELKLAQQSTNGLVQLIEQLFGTPAAFAGSSTEQISSLLGSGSTSLSSLVPPLIAFGGGQTIFLANLPGATANFASTMSVVQNAERILLRAEDGEPASFFVGERYPINFATLSNEFTTQGATPGIGEATLATGASPRGVAVAATRSTSSNLDIITANHDAGTVSVLLGNGDGTFQTNVDYPAAPNSASRLVAVATGSFRPASATGPAPLDLAVVDQGTNRVEIFLGNGDGTFQLPVAYPVGDEPSGIVVADFNGDGHPDIAVTNTSGNSVSILLGNGDANGTFQAATTFPLNKGQGPIGIATADFNGDGHPDLVVANALTNTATMLFGDGHGNFSSQLDIDTGTFPVAVVATDFNNDGLQDFAVANQNDGTVSVFLNTGPTGSASFSAPNVIATGNQPDALIAGQFTTGTAPDLAVVNSADGTVNVLFGLGDGTFPANFPVQINGGVTCSDLPPPSVPCQGIASGVFTSSGLLDAVVTDPANNTVTEVINSNQLAAANEQLPYPGFQYEDIGIKAKATPHIHPSGEVTLSLNFELRSLSAVSFNGIPVITNRSIEQTVRLRSGEPSVLSGIFSNSEMLPLTGSPGIAEIPVLQNLLSNVNPQTEQTELVIVVNPRIVRIAPRTEAVFFAGHERESPVSSAGGEPEQPQQPPTVPGQLPPPGPPRPPGPVPAPPGENPQVTPPGAPTRP